MSKKSGKSKKDRGDSSTPTTSDDGGAPTVTRKKLTVPERFASKSQHVRDLVQDLHKMAGFYGAPAEIVNATHSLMVEADSWCGAIKEMVDSGWLPAAKAALKALNVGDEIAINQESTSLYEYIPADVLLAVGAIERSANGRIKRILLKDARVFGDGVPEGVPAAFGWAQLSHVERR